MRAVLHPLLRQLLGLLAGLLVAASGWAQDASGFVVIGSAGLPKLDAKALERLYTGRAVELAGQPVSVLNLSPGHAVRQRFLLSVVQMDEEKYINYWLVRRHVGKGTPPPEFASSTALAAAVQERVGTLGYIPASELKPGMNVIYRP